MSREEAGKFVRELEKAANSHDARRLLEFYAEEAVMVSPVFKGIMGRAAIAKSWDTVFSQFPDWTVNISDILVENRTGLRPHSIDHARCDDVPGLSSEVRGGHFH